MKALIKKIALCLLLPVVSQQALAKNCYLLITESSGFKYNSIFEVSSTLLNNFVAPVLEVPRSGLGSKDCTYNLAILKDNGTLTVSINGPEISSIGESQSPGLLGVQKALLIAIFRSDEEVRAELCEGYNNLIPDQCLSVSEEEDTFEGVWKITYEEENEQIFMSVDEEDQITICELKDGKASDVSAGKILDEQFFWGEEKPVEVFLDNENLIFGYEDGEEVFRRVEELPETCVEKLEEDY